MNSTEKLFEFIKASPTAYHAVAEVARILDNNGYTAIREGDTAALADGGKYYTVRGAGSLIAFRYVKGARGFMISAAHTDSPTLKVKPSVESVGAYTRLDTEKYGGSILYSWLDRPLSVAGRACVRADGGIKCTLVDLERDVAVIPSLAIHMNRNVNSGVELNPATDMLPLVASREGAGGLMELVSQTLGVEQSDILSHDLYLYNRQSGSVIGTHKEYLLAPRFDDLGCALCALEGFLTAKPSQSIPLLALFDNEEVGSESGHGAASTFLYDTLATIVPAREEYLRMIASSLMLSIDVAHAKHPAHPELSDANNAPILNGGIVIKYNANHRYATDSVGTALLKLICERAGVPVQSFAARADQTCGSTIGPVSTTKVPAITVDVGLPQLAMHSSAETAGVRDLDYMIAAVRELYSVSLVKTDDGFELAD